MWVTGWFFVFILYVHITHSSILRETRGHLFTYSFCMRYTLIYGSSLCPLFYSAGGIHLLCRPSVRELCVQPKSRYCVAPTQNVYATHHSRVCCIFFVSKTHTATANMQHDIQIKSRGGRWSRAARRVLFFKIPIRHTHTHTFSDIVSASLRTANWGTQRDVKLRSEEVRILLCDRRVTTILVFSCVLCLPARCWRSTVHSAFRDRWFVRRWYDRRRRSSQFRPYEMCTNERRLHTNVWMDISLLPNLRCIHPPHFLLLILCLYQLSISSNLS